MDCPISAQYQPALSSLSVQNQQRILCSLARLAARQSADTTLRAVVTTLNALIRPLPGRRHVVLTDDITQTTVQDISAFKAWPNLPEKILAWAGAHKDAVYLPERPMIVPGGEDSKNDLTFVQRIIHQLQRMQICRHSYVVAIGS